MSEMDMTATNTSTTMDMSMMAMTFFTSYATPIYSNMWTPTSIGSYAGTCIFVITLAVIFRYLLALKAWKESEWLHQESNRRYVTVAGKALKAERISSDSDRKRMVLSENGVEEEVFVVQKKGVVGRPWRITVDPQRAAIDTVVAGVGYLLMLAVMTMNVGYFLSVLGGTFLGSILIGRYAAFDH